jgi:GNAT superfamily N-acetyltransferase
MRQVRDLIDASRRSVLKHASAWCWSDNKMVHAYLRVQRKMIDGQFLHCLVLSNVSVAEEYQRKGYFKRWFIELEALANAEGFAGLDVENVMNMHLGEFLKRRGYTDHVMPGDRGSPPSYFKARINHEIRT